MAKDKKVEQITNLEDDFAQWYTDICRKAELVEYASVKGFTILRPYGFAIWENMQRLMDAEFKKTGHENVAMPVLIPESLLKKEGELVNGFAPEVAWVTMGGSEKLEERLAFRPTSETMFCDHWSRVLQTYRQLPMLYNQWCSVIRWEKTTRPFLRSREFWWQEGHTIHETAAEAEAETEQQLNCYADVCKNALAMPVVKGRKTDKEKFAGAEATYTIECMMKDHKALQSGTSHFFGDKFSRAYDVTFTGRDNTLQYPFQTSWGASTRLIGAIIMTHSDNHGLVLPPVIAPTQVVVIPIAQHKEGVLEAAAALRDRLSAAGIRVSMDDSDQSAGWKFAQYEMKGVPLRVEIGPKDMEKGQCCIARRDTGEKTFVPLTELESAVQQLLHGALQLRQGDEGLFAGVAAGDAALALLHVLGADLHTQGHALHLVLSELPAGGLVAVVHADADARGAETVAQGGGGLQHALLVLGDGDHHHLGGSDHRGQHQTVVVAVGHNDGADQAGRRAPAGLEGILQGIVAAGERHVVGPGELVTEEVAGAGLQGLVVLHHALDGIGGLGTGEFLLVGLAALHHGHGQRVFAHVGVAVQLLLRLGLGLGGRLVDGVTLLPPELAAPQERAGGLLPADDGAPLVVEHRQLAVGLQYAGPVVAEHRLGRGAEGKALFELLAAAHRDPRDLGREAIDKLALFLEQALGD